MQWQHLSPDLIKAFAYRLTVLQPRDFRHLLDCDACAHMWWGLKQEAKRERSDDTNETKEKTAC